jgi:hypothetical protein
MPSGMRISQASSDPSGAAFCRASREEPHNSRHPMGQPLACSPTRFSSLGPVGPVDRRLANAREQGAPIPSYALRTFVLSHCDRIEDLFPHTTTRDATAFIPYRTDRPTRQYGILSTPSPPTISPPPPPPPTSKGPDCAYTLSSLTLYLTKRKGSACSRGKDKRTRLPGSLLPLPNPLPLLPCPTNSPSHHHLFQHCLFLQLNLTCALRHLIFALDHPTHLISIIAS